MDYSPTLPTHTGVDMWFIKTVSYKLKHIFQLNEVIFAQHSWHWTKYPITVKNPLLQLSTRASWLRVCAFHSLAPDTYPSQRAGDS